jgi:enoyl-CoA hydratase/carnithine racemase
MQRATRIAANPPHAVRLTKRLMLESRELTAPAALELAASMQAMCHKMADHREAVEARLAKRAPNFTGK